MTPVEYVDRRTGARVAEAIMGDRALRFAGLAKHILHVYKHDAASSSSVTALSPALQSARLA